MSSKAKPSALVPEVEVLVPADWRTELDQDTDLAAALAAHGRYSVTLSGSAYEKGLREFRKLVTEHSKAASAEHFKPGHSRSRAVSIGQRAAWLQG